MPNIYFELTREFNREGVIALLSSGQAVVFHRLAIMSKDGDWVLREQEGACRRVLDVLARHGARYRPCAPLDPRWLRGGWSSHFEFADERGRRIRCDFVSRPPRLTSAATAALFERASEQDDVAVVDVPTLIAMKRTQRAKDYPIIGALARLLPPEQELCFTTDPDRVLELAASHGQGIERPAVVAARNGNGRDEIVVALAREIDHQQRLDRERVLRYLHASEGYLREFQRLRLDSLELRDAHARAVTLAHGLLPETVS